MCIYIYIYVYIYYIIYIIYIYVYIHIYIYIYIYIYICKNENNAPSGYHRNGFEAIHALGHMMYGYIMCT